MNVLNRLIMLIIALLLIGVPVFLLLVGLGVLPANQVAAITGYRVALEALGGLSVSDFDTGARVVLGIVGILVALVALFLLLREITIGKRVARRALIEDRPGRRTAITAGAVRHLAEGAAREIGAASPTCYLASENGRYEVECDIQVPGSQNFSELAAQTRENIRKVLEEQRVPTKDVQVTVQGTASQE